jgi:hypothetical protein
MSDYGTTEKVITARKGHRCDGYRCNRSPRRIAPGERYTRGVCFPGHDANGGTVPWVMLLCSDCRPVTPETTE